MDIYSPKVITEEMLSSFSPCRLYIKKLANILYFGKTNSTDIAKYPGSGTVWGKYIKKYGKEQIQTLWVSDWYHDPSEIQEIALHFSRENAIVESSSWANRKPENGLDGGGARGKRRREALQYGEKNSSYDHTVYTFYHEDGRIMRCTQYDLRTKYDLNGGNLSEVISGKQQSIKGWRITALAAPNALGMNHPSFHITHTFYHESGITETCKKIEFSEKYNISLKRVSSLLRGAVKELNGWRLHKEKIPHGKVDINIYSFIHENGTMVRCTKNELIAAYGIPRSTLNAVIRKERGYNDARGWKVLN